MLPKLRTSAGLRTRGSGRGAFYTGWSWTDKDQSTVWKWPCRH